MTLNHVDVHRRICIHIAADTIATATHGVTFSAALSRDNFFACQFHPEKSGPVGETILKNFLSI